MDSEHTIDGLGWHWNSADKILFLLFEVTLEESETLGVKMTIRNIAAPSPETCASAVAKVVANGVPGLEGKKCAPLKWCDYVALGYDED